MSTGTAAKSTLVFVYGTLKRGFYNAKVLEERGAQFVSRCRTRTTQVPPAPDLLGCGGSKRRLRESRYGTRTAVVMWAWQLSQTPRELLPAGSKVQGAAPAALRGSHTTNSVIFETQPYVVLSPFSPADPFEFGSYPLGPAGSPSLLTNTTSPICCRLWGKVRFLRHQRKSATGIQSVRSTAKVG
jgi:hypothetical protein